MQVTKYNTTGLGKNKVRYAVGGGELKSSDDEYIMQEMKNVLRPKTL